MGTPSDWVSGERVFGPPAGTLDIDWLVPAVVEQAGVGPAAARAALAMAWAEQRSTRAVDPLSGERVHRVATSVLAEALEHYRVDQPR